MNTFYLVPEVYLSLDDSGTKAYNYVVKVVLCWVMTGCNGAQRNAVYPVITSHPKKLEEPQTVVMVCMSWPSASVSL